MRGLLEAGGNPQRRFGHGGCRRLAGPFASVIVRRLVLKTNGFSNFDFEENISPKMPRSAWMVRDRGRRRPPRRLTGRDVTRPWAGLTDALRAEQGCISVGTAFPCSA